MAQRFLVAAALLLWGYGIGALPAAVGLIALLEAPMLLRLQAPIEPAGYCRVADFTSVLFSALAVFCFVRYGVFGIYRILAWLPYCLILPLLVQRLGDRGRMPLGTLFFGLRQRGWDAGTIDWTGPYFACCLLAATFGEASIPGGFVVALALLGGYLLAMRPRGQGRLAPMAIMVLCAVAAWSAHTALLFAQQRFELLAGSWWLSFRQFDRDPGQTITAIGSIGRMKISDAIQVRVHTRHLPHLPLYLRDASYNEFRNGVWTARAARPEAIDVDPGGHSWTLAANPGTEVLDLSVHMRRELGVVPTPLDPARLEGREIVEVQRTALGTLLLEAPPGAVRYRVYPATGAAPAAPLPEYDLAIPAGYRDDILTIARQLDLAAVPAEEAIARIERFFAADFRYALPGASRPAWRKTLVDFLRRDRAGHCEYFATATVLLARAAGVPARYEVGYLMQEYSPWERAWIARARHRHAWATVLVGGNWRVVDTTPSVWLDREQAAAGSHWFSDVYAWLRYRIARIGRDADDTDRTPLLWLLPPLSLILLWRLSHGTLRPRRKPTASWPPPVALGMDSELFDLIDAYRRRGIEFLPGETLAAWLRRVLPETPDRVRLLELHYRYRFDPAGLARADRDALRALVRRHWPVERNA
ncbi:MAG: transglutaminase domain-containing protein [Gammaproteobacteria bacterium]|nr:transglutaminase domain-containing protein [Gammaproteobacteria bacterium]